MSERNSDINLTTAEIALLRLIVVSDGVMVAPDTIIAAAGLLEEGYVNIEQDREGLFAFATENARLLINLIELRSAAGSLLDDVRARHPGEDLRCPHMIALDQALNGVGRAA